MIRYITLSMVQSIQVGEVSIDVTRKNIRNVNLRVLPPTGSVRISAPRHVKLETIRDFALSRLDWIRRAQRKIRERKREVPRKYVDDEIHFVSGEPYLLKVVERNAPPGVEIKDDRLILCVRPGTDRPKRQAVVSRWYRQQVRNEAEQIIARWEPLLGVKISKLYIRQMKTRWGSCNTAAGSIRLNTELGKKPIDCLEYVVVHEMVHLLEPAHNRRFTSLMDRFMPDWRSRKETLLETKGPCVDII